MVYHVVWNAGTVENPVSGTFPNDGREFKVWVFQAAVQPRPMSRWLGLPLLEGLHSSTTREKEILPELSKMEPHVAQSSLVSDLSAGYEKPRS